MKQRPLDLLAGVNAYAQEWVWRFVPRRADEECVWGGGVDKARSSRHVAGGGRTVDPAMVDRVFEAIQEGIEKPGAILTRARVAKLAGGLAFRQLLDAGRVRAEGKTSGRRYFPAQSSSRGRAARGEL